MLKTNQNVSKHSLFLALMIFLTILLLILITITPSYADTKYYSNRIRVIATKGQKLAFVSICGYLKTGKEYCETVRELNWNEYDSKNQFLINKQIEISWRIINDPNTKDLKLKPSSRVTIKARTSGSSSEWTSLAAGRYKNSPTGGYRYVVPYYLFKYNPIVTNAY